MHLDPDITTWRLTHLAEKKHGRYDWLLTAPQFARPVPLTSRQLCSGASARKRVAAVAGYRFAFLNRRDWFGRIVPQIMQNSGFHGR